MKRDLTALSAQRFDLAIIGGGVTGSTIARDAAMRGLKVALVEQRDFSWATSSATSKLVHGGLRYLKSFELALVRESLKERRIWQRIAPHLVYPLTFLVPQPKDRKGTLTLRIGLALYDLLAFDRRWLDDPEQRLDGHRHLSAGETRRRAPVISDSHYPDAIAYSDCQMHAPERLGLLCLQDAAAHGAVIANYAEASSMREADGAAALTVKDTLTGVEHTLEARLVINATGPWADLTLERLAPGLPHPKILRAKGIHIITRALTPGDAIASYSSDGHFFVLPWRGHAIIGTTDDIHYGRPEDVVPLEDEIAKLIAFVNARLPAAKLTRADVLYAYAGVRPLIDPGAGAAGSYKTSRKAEVLDHAAGGMPRLISAMGGKWTTSRHVAAQAVDAALRKLGRRAPRAPTDRAPLNGGSTGNFNAFAATAVVRYNDLPEALIRHLARLYGVRLHEVIALGRSTQGALEPLGPTRPDCGAQILFAMREEMAVTLEDALFRRTGIATLGHPGAALIESAAALMAEALGWSDSERRAQLSAVEARLVRNKAA